MQEMWDGLMNDLSWLPFGGPHIERRNEKEERDSLSKCRGARAADGTSVKS
jgi:hypothetical protein